MLKSKKVLLLLSICIVIILLFVATEIRRSQNSGGNVSTLFRPSPTPLPLTFTPKIFTNPTNNYSFPYPSNWTLAQKSSSDDEVTTFTFNENGKEYSFQA